MFALSPNPSDNKSLAETIAARKLDRILDPVPIDVTEIIDGIGYGSTLFTHGKTAQRKDYIIELESASPNISLEAMTIFKQVVATHTISNPEFSQHFGHGHVEISRLFQVGTHLLPKHLTNGYEMDVYSDRALHEFYMQCREAASVLNFVSEVLTHRLLRKECGKLAMRNLQEMHCVATAAIDQAEDFVAKWLAGVVDWCVRSARAFGAGNDDYQDLCCSLLLEIGTIKMATSNVTPPHCYLDNHVLDVLRQGAVVVFAIGLMCSGLPASRLIIQATRLEYWLSFSFGANLFMQKHTPVRAMVAEAGKQSGLCCGRVYQWAAANCHFGYSFAEWCIMVRRPEVIRRTGEFLDIQHLDCGTRCEQGRSITAGHAGHMPWCNGCTETNMKEMSDSELLGFDTSAKKLRAMRHNEPYVAISHVWGQRLFGQDTRSLGQCAISELDRLAAECKVSCIWLDTLCIPSEPKARRKCIDGMRSIYRDATCVAVYDRAIITANANDRVGFAFEISVSDWNSRVWTLQEGLLNKKLIYVQEKRYIPHRKVRVHPYLKRYSVFTADELLKHIGVGGSGNLHPHEVFGLAAGRTTSHSVDYVCGLGALLKDPIARDGVDLSTAAVAMAKVMGTVDIGLLCAKCPRVNVEGYCWMPLGCQDLQPVIQHGVTGTVLDEGLYLEANSLHLGRLKLHTNPTEHHLYVQKLFGGHMHTNGKIVVLASVDLNLEVKYDFICGSGAGSDMAFGFMVAVGDDISEYISPAVVIGLHGPVQCSQGVYVIGGPGVGAKDQKLKV